MDFWSSLFILSKWGITVKTSSCLQMSFINVVSSLYSQQGETGPHWIWHESCPLKCLPFVTILKSKNFMLQNVGDTLNFVS